MILQYDSKLNSIFPLMEPNGCATLLPFWTASRINHTYIDRDVIIAKLTHWIDKDWVDEELYINEWAEIHNDLGLNVRYLGHIDPSAIINPDQFAYGYWYSTTSGYHHFTAIDNWHKRATYDPLGNSKTAEVGTIETLRLFTLL